MWAENYMPARIWMSRTGSHTDIDTASHIILPLFYQRGRRGGSSIWEVSGWMWKAFRGLWLPAPYIPGLSGDRRRWASATPGSRHFHLLQGYTVPWLRRGYR